MTTKKELIDAIHTKLAGSVTKAEIQSILEASFTAIKDELSKADGKFTHSGFGTFERRTRAARIGQHPKTHAKISIPESHTVAFKPSSSLKRDLNK